VVSRIRFDNGMLQGPLTRVPLGRRGDRGQDGFYCPRPFGGEGGAHPALSPAGAGRVRGSRLLSILTWDTTLGMNLDVQGP
jgi:hypothetical protein